LAGRDFTFCRSLQIYIHIQAKRKAFISRERERIERTMRTISCLAAAVVVAAIFCTSTTAFVPVGRTHSTATRHTQISTNLQVLISPADFRDWTPVNHVAQDFFASTSVILSDAAAATAEAAVTADKGGGWWQSYLQIFRNILVFVHNTVDGPLKSMGVENTWGISIAIFTCSKYE